MGMIFINIAFPGELPTRENLEAKLAASTGLQVRVELETITDLSRSTLAETWTIHFQSVSEKFADEIWCWRDGQKLALRQPMDMLNRCPNYTLLATQCALLNLGGIRTNLKGEPQLGDNPPDYGMGTFEEWKKLNKGSRPPMWKSAFFTVAAILYALICLVAVLVIIPYWFAQLLLLPWRLRRNAK